MQEASDQAVVQEVVRDLEGGGADVKKSAASGPWSHKAIFVIMGTAELFVWNAVLCILEDVRSKIYKDYASMSDSLNAVNNLTNLGVAAYCVYSGAMNQFWILSSIVVLAVACFGLACVTQWAPGLHGVVWYHIINLFAGAACGMFQTGGFGLASALPAPMTGYVSTGQGISGVVTWVMWIIIANSKLDVKQSMWTLMCCGMVVVLFSFASYFYLLRMPDVKERVVQIQKTLKDEVTNPDAPTYRYLFVQCWRHVVTVWWCFTTTLFIFPTIGPLGWNTGSFYNYLIGCFQIGDLVGRYAPNLLPFIIPSPIALFWTVIGRTILIVFGLCSYFMADNGFWGSKGFQVVFMCVLALSNGWLATCVYVNTPNVIKQQDWISRLGSMVMCGLLFGIACGLWSARIFTAVAN